MTDPTYGRAEVEPKPQRWAYDEDGMLINVGHSQNVDYLRNRGEDYGVMYDSRGRISKVLYPGENNQPVMEVEYQYNDGGQITKIIARDLTKGAVTDIYCMEYGYDANGRKVRQVIKEKEADADTDAYYVTTFNYDSRDMLKEEKYLRWDDANSIWKVMYWGRYNYDTAGNMVMRTVEQIVNGAQKIYVDNMFSYSRGYQLKSFQRLALADAELRTYNLTYDANGNFTHIQRQQGQQPFTDSFYEITEMEFDYDAKNRLVKYRFGGAGSWYDIKYDALGRVRERVDLTPTTTKYYSDGRQLVQQLDNSNNVQFDYLRGSTALDRQWNEGNDTRRFYIKDNLGTVWALVNPSDMTVKRYNYNAWGEHLDKDDTDFPTDSNWMRYIGCRVEAFGKGSTTQRDAIYHFDRRHYLPITNEFLERDLLNLRSLSMVETKPYTYCFGDPVNREDSLGLCATCSPGSAGWAPAASPWWSNKGAQPPSAKPAPSVKLRRICTCRDIYEEAERACKYSCWPKPTLYQLCCTQFNALCFLTVPSCDPGTLWDMFSNTNEICGDPDSELRKCICSHPLANQGPCEFKQARYNLAPPCDPPCAGGVCKWCWLPNGALWCICGRGDLGYEACDCMRSCIGNQGTVPPNPSPARIALCKGCAGLCKDSTAEDAWVEAILSGCIRGFPRC